MSLAYLRTIFSRGFVLARKSFQGVIKIRALLLDLRSPLRAPFAHPIRFLCCCLIGLVLSGMSALSNAEGTVNPTYSASAPPIVKYAGYIGVFDTPAAACQNQVDHQFDIGSSTDLVYDHVGSPTSTRYPPENFDYCYARSPNGGVSWFSVIMHMRSCDGKSWVGYAITCPRNVCPANSTGAPEANPTSCTCDTDYAPDAAKTSCVSACPIAPLPDLPKDDLCTQSLDKGAGKDVDGACPPLNAKLTAWNGEMKCFADKVHALGIPYKEPSATIRTEAYQQHLLDVYKKSLNIADLSDAEKQVCSGVIADVNAQMDHHKITFPPSSKGSVAPHVKGIAFDIPENVAKALKARVTMTQVKASIATHHPGCISCLHIPLVTGDVQDYIDSAMPNPPACKLDWGGRFVNPVTKKTDIVHFQLQQP